MNRKSTSKERQCALLMKENSEARMIALVRALEKARKLADNGEQRAPELSTLFSSIQANIGEAEKWARREVIAERK